MTCKNSWISMMNGKGKWNRRIDAYQTPAEAEREMHGQMVAALVIFAAAGIGLVIGALIVAWLCGLI